MTLDKMKLELQKKRVQLGVDELEFKVLERLEDIERLKKNIEISKEAVINLDIQISELGE